MVPGKATPGGTAAFAKRYVYAHPEHWRSALGLTLSSLGIGTYLGDAGAVTDAKYTAAILEALALGINVIDSAINYRSQRSERAIGAALRRAIDNGILQREEIILCTKGGYVVDDLGQVGSGRMKKKAIGHSIRVSKDIVAGCHCMTPEYLCRQLEQSRKNLGVDTIDVYYVHNPELQMEVLGEGEYYNRLTEAFRALEECADRGEIQWYGTATWKAYRVPPQDASHVSLDRTLKCAVAAGGKDHRFRVVQLPFNFALLEAYTDATQRRGRDVETALGAARALGLTVLTSVPLLQKRLLGHPVLRSLDDKFPGLKTDAQRCLQFVRSTPGITAALCGMKTVDHIQENAQVAKVPPLSPDQYASFFARTS